MSSALLVLVLTLAQQAMPGIQPRPAAPGEAQAKGTAIVRGRITAADTGRPLRRARVTLSAPRGEARSTSTNVRGEYELRDVPAGRYQLGVQRSGYLPMMYGQRRSGEPPRPLEIAEGQTFERMDLSLPRASVISGRVLDETGEPIAGVRVWPLRSEFFRGRRRLVPAGNLGETDDGGNFRIVNVPPGQYVVMASSRETWVTSDRQTHAYAPTFFPGTARATEAAPVKVALGQETPNVDFTLVASRAVTVSGTAMRSDGMPFAGGRVTLSQEVAGSTTSWSTSIASAAVGADGTWQLRNVPPGEYELEASAQERDRLPERAAMTILVQGADVGGISLVADTGGTITGLVVTEDGQPAPAGSGRLRVSAESVAAGTSRFGVPRSDDDGVVGPDGRFEIRGVLGPSTLRVAPLASGWVVKSIEGGDRDYAETPLEVRGGKTLDVRVVVTNRFPDVTGRISDDKGNFVDGVALLVPADEEKWFDPLVLRSSRTDQSGVFRMQAVRPGEYFAVALESVQAWQTRDPEFLESLRSASAKVTVREGQAEQLNLRVRK